MQHSSGMARTVCTERWELDVPAHVTEDSPLVCIPTIHPRGDQRIVRCAQVALNSGYRVKFVWLGQGTPSVDTAIEELLLPPARSFVQRALKLGRLARLGAAARADIWHIHDFYMLPHALRWHRKSGRPVVYDVHEYYARYYSEKLPFPKKLRQVVQRALDWYQVSVVRKMGGANVVAEPMAPLYRLRGVPVSVSPNLPMRAPYDSQSISPFPGRSGKAVHIGTLSESYGMQLLVNMAAESHRRGLNVTFDLVAKFPNSVQEARFHELLSLAGNPPNVHLIPIVPAHEIASLLSGYGIGLSTILSGGQNDIAIPTKLYEYALMGLVVIGTDRLAQRRFLDEWGVADLFSDTDWDGMVDAIGMIAAMDEMQEATEITSTRARGHLFWEVTAERSLSVLFSRLLYPGAFDGI